MRHPLYLGNFLILIGFTLSAANLYVLIGVILFFLIWYPAAIAYEDGKLERIFEDEWRAWSKNIPGMFPTGLNWKPNQDAVWDVRQSMIRNGELVYTLFEIGAAVLLWYRATG